MFCLILPSSVFHYISVVPPILLVLICLIYFQGKLREKLTVLVVFYLTLLFAESVTVFLLYILHFLTAGKFPVHNMIFLNAGPSELAAYTSLYSSALILICHKLIPVLKQYIDLLTISLFIRLAGPYLSAYALTNFIFLFVCAGSWPVRIISSLLYFTAIAALAVYAFRNIRLFTERERERTVLYLKKQQLEQQLQYSEILSRQYKETRKINHDISSHLTAVNLLLKSGRKTDAEEYIRSILKQTKE